MFKISHEVPRCLLVESLNFNDYQYALVHLLEIDEEYRNHFLRCRDLGVEIYLDNSLHELGTAMGGEILLKWINILKPKYVFIPDVWENTTESIDNATEWINIEIPKETTKVAIVQANNLFQAKLCYDTYKRLGYEKIAFSYGADYYLEYSSHPNVDIRRALGRVEVISSLYKNFTIRHSDNIHLLGTSWPYEFSFYDEMPFIKSIDTSNPIMAAVEGLEYDDYGITCKPKMNLNNSFDIGISKIDLELIYKNVNKFKKIINKMENNNVEPHYVSLYDYLGKPAGSTLGKEVFQYSKQMGIRTKPREISNPKYKGKVMLYPTWFLQQYFLCENKI